MSTPKYAPLERYLSTISTSSWRATFADIEKVLGKSLPDSARHHRAWWSNNGNNNVMTKAWRAAGWMTEQVDMENQVLVFRKVDNSGKSKSASAIIGPQAGVAPDVKKFDFVFGRLKGTVTWTGDLTEPTGEVWNADNGLL